MKKFFFLATLFLFCVLTQAQHFEVLDVDVSCSNNWSTKVLTVEVTGLKIGQKISTSLFFTEETGGKHLGIYADNISSVEDSVYTPGRIKKPVVFYVNVHPSYISNKTDYFKYQLILSVEDGKSFSFAGEGVWRQADSYLNVYGPAFKKVKKTNFLTMSYDCLGDKVWNIKILNPEWDSLHSVYDEILKTIQFADRAYSEFDWRSQTLYEFQFPVPVFTAKEIKKYYRLYKKYEKQGVVSESSKKRHARMPYLIQEYKALLESLHSLEKVEVAVERINPNDRKKYKNFFSLSLN